MWEGNFGASSTVGLYILEAFSFTVDMYMWEGNFGASSMVGLSILAATFTICDNKAVSRNSFIISCKYLLQLVRI